VESEKSFFDKTREAVSELGARLFRNNVGVAVHRDKNGNEHTVRYGLCVGSSDLIGWTTISVTPEMVGKNVAVFTALEGKRGRDQLKAEQSRFLQAVRNAGGIASTFSSPDAAVGIIKDDVNWLERGLKF